MQLRIGYWQLIWLYNIFWKKSETNLKRKRSSSLEVFCRKGALRNFVKFTRKHLYQILFLKKVTGLRPATLLKKRLCNRCFPVNLAKFVRKPFFAGRLHWLLLKASTHLQILKVVMKKTLVESYRKTEL